MKEYEDWKLQYGGGVWVKRELGIARCGLACCLCSENVGCNGCNSGECPDKEWCENRTCSIKKGISNLLKDMVWKLCLIALKEMKKTELSIIERGYMEIMMVLLIWKS